MWDGPAALAVVAVAFIALGIVALDWLTLTTPPGGQTTRTFWWVISHAQTDGVGLADQVLFSSTPSGPWMHLLGAAGVAGLLLTLVRHRNRRHASSIAAVATATALVAGYLAVRMRDGANQADPIIPTFGASGELGPGAYVTVGGFIAGAAAAVWVASRR